MSKKDTKETDSFDEVETNETDTVSEQSDNSLAEVLQALRAQEARLEELAAENKALRQQNGDTEELDENDAGVRRPAETMTLATIDGMPIIDMRLEKNLAKDGMGNSYIRNYNAICTVFGKKDPVVITYGEMGEPTDYLNIPRKTFQLTNQNAADLSGASRIENNKIITRGEKVDEIDRSSGVPVRTGKQVELVTRNDIRYYTIKVGDETVELHQDKIYR